MNFKYLLMITLLLLGSCKKYDSIISDARDFKEDHPEKRIFDGEVEPAFPSESENNKTLLGVDANKNGIRDDIDIWINYVGLNYNHRMALRQVAREEVKRLVAGSSEDTKNYDQVAKDFHDAKLCASFIESGNFSNEITPRSLIVQLTYNNADRRKGYEQLHRSTLVYKSNRDDIHLRNSYLVCQFKVENLQDLINKRNKKNVK